MNMGDHITRARYRQKTAKNEKTRVIGVVLGQKDRHSLEVVNSIEIKFDKGKDTNDIKIDSKFAAERIAAYKTMFPDLTMVGWYSVTGAAGPNADEPSA